jgi:hypothetical protein
LRWKVLEGKARDTEAMSDLVAEVEPLSWVRGVPIVFDRAMGNATTVSRLLKSGLHFVTAVRRPEFGTYADDNALPASTLKDLAGSGDLASILSGPSWQRILRKPAPEPCRCPRTWASISPYARPLRY